MSITSITTTTEGNLSGGETTLRFNLDAAGIKPTGQEIFAITATIHHLLWIYQVIA